MMNTNIAFTIREISQKVPIVVNADLDDSVDILELAGSTYVFQFTKMLGQSLARRVLGPSTRANVIGKIESLLIAEAPAMRTPLVGKTLMQSQLRETIGINVVKTQNALVPPVSCVLTSPPKEISQHGTQLLDAVGFFDNTLKPVGLTV
jgi:Trk K+ transport system NAD-binding subunit